jgi:penicillin-insensitive murein DD-endopeptidase
VIRPILIGLSVLVLASTGLPTVKQVVPVPQRRPAPSSAPTLPAAKELFGHQSEPTHGPARAIGGYADGCLAGGVALATNGPTWQVMRLSRNRNWGHPILVRFLERYAARAKAVGWSGLLVGDMAQPRGGPMLNGHSSHQIGLDVDIWLTPMPDHELTKEERETIAAPNLVAQDGKSINPALWSPAHYGLIRAAALDPEVDRVFVNAAIKQQLCQQAGSDRGWLYKVRPWYKHNDHEHIRLHCPASSGECKGQLPVPSEEGCGKELDWWFSEIILHPKPPSGPGRELTLANLPPACRQVLDGPSAQHH